LPEKIEKKTENAASPNKIEDRAQTPEDLLDEKRREAYLDSKTQDVLRHLLQGGEEREICPVFTSGIGYSYSILENNTSSHGNISREFLENLVNFGLMQRKFFDSITACPNCNSSVVTIHNRCPRCRSHDVEKTSLTEHIPCGYIGQRENYVNNRCPKCNELLVAGQFRNMGQWYICHSCTERFEISEFDMICRSCGKWFSTKEGNITIIGKYSLNPHRKREIRQNVASIENIKNVLIELGFNVQMPGFAVGQKSKLQHNFSLLATKIIDGKEKVIALDHAVSETEVSVSPLIVYIYKTSEIKVDLSIFVALPQMNAQARQIAQGHDILLIEGYMDEKELTEKVKSRLNSTYVQVKSPTEFEMIPNTDVQKDHNSIISKFKVFKKT
jgi:hypothetical protein